MRSSISLSLVAIRSAKFLTPCALSHGQFYYSWSIDTRSDLSDSCNLMRCPSGVFVIYKIVNEIEWKVLKLLFCYHFFYIL